MKQKYFLTSLLAACIAMQTNGQPKIIAETESFEEPTEGSVRLIQLRNGNTIHIYAEEKRGLQSTVYNAKHVEVSKNDIDLPGNKFMKDSWIEKIFEIGGDVVVFLHHGDKGASLYRVIIDGSTGKLKKTDELAQIDGMSFKQKNAWSFDDSAGFPEFIVTQFGDEDAYSIVGYNAYSSDLSNIYEVAIYDGSHKELRREKIAPPPSAPKFIKPIDVVMTGRESVSIFAAGFSPSKKEVPYSGAILEASVSTKNPKVAFKEVNESFNNLRDVLGVCRFNPLTNKIVLVMIGRETYGGPYKRFLRFVEPATNKITDKFDLELDDVTANSMLETFGKNTYGGFPQALVINQDGSFTIISEEFNVRRYETSRSVTTFTDFGNTLIQNFTKTGVLTNSYYIAKLYSKAHTYHTFYHAKKERSSAMLSRGDQYKSMYYIPGPTSNYLFFNDTKENRTDLTLGRSAKAMKTVSTSDAFQFELKGNNLLPPASYLFGDTGKKDVFNFGLFEGADYNQKANTLAIMKTRNDDGSKKASIVWVQL